MPKGVPRRTVQTHGPMPVDVHVGARVRLRRTLLGMSQMALAAKIGLTFQQVQKYERGTNRIGSSRLFELSQILDVPISYFFDDMDPEVAATKSIDLPNNIENKGASREAGLLTKRETLEFVRAYYRIKDSKVRRQVLQLTRILGETESHDQNASD